MKQGYAIFRNTFLETVRQPVFGLILILTGIAILAIPLSSAQVYTLSVGTTLDRAPQRMVAELCLSTILLSGLLLSVFASSGVISREIEKKTALTVLTKRVSRFAFICGKFAGLALAVSVAVSTFIMLMLMIVRFGSNTAAYQPIDYGAIISTFGAIFIALFIASFRNYFSGKSWIGTFSLSLFCTISFAFVVMLFLDKDFHFAFKEGHFGSYDWQAAIAGVLTLEAILLLCAIAVAASTRLGAAGNFTICAICFTGGLTSEYFYDNYKYIAVKVWHTIMPNLQTFWMSEALKREVDIPLSYFINSTLYAGSYILALLFIASFLFYRREIA